MEIDACHDLGNDLLDTQVGRVNRLTHLGVDRGTDSHHLPNPFQLVRVPEQGAVFHSLDPFQDSFRRRRETNDLSVPAEAVKVLGVHDRPPPQSR